MYTFNRMCVGGITPEEVAAKIEEQKKSQERRKILRSRIYMKD